MDKRFSLLLLAVLAGAANSAFGDPVRDQPATLATCIAKVHLGQSVVTEPRHVLAPRIDEYLELHSRAVEGTGIPSLVPAGPARPLTN